MGKPKVAGSPDADPTLPKVPLVLSKETHYLVFTFAALALAEAKLREQGVSANLLVSIDLSSWDATKLVPLLYAALITHSPEITPAAVAAMIQFRDLPKIIDALYEAWRLSIEEPKEGEDNTAPLDTAK